MLEVAGTHRQILQEAMKKQGFVPLATEWGHFDSPDWQQYPVENVSFDEIDSGRADQAGKTPMAGEEVLVQRVRELELEVQRLRARLRQMENPQASPEAVANPTPTVELRGKAFGR